MINVVNQNWFIIEKKLYYGYQEPNPKYINLAQVMGEDMRYEKVPYQLIDYPGEYDIQGISIQCFLGADKKLNYVIDIHNKKIWIIQSVDVLDLEEMAGVTFRLYTDDRILSKIDQMELEGDRQKLEANE